MALGQRRAVRAHQQRQVPVGGRTQFERLEHQQLARRVGQVVFAAQHVRDAHFGIVDGIAEEEGRAAVGAPQDEVADVVGGETLRPMHHVVEFDRLAGGNAKTGGRRDALRALAHAGFGGQLAAGARIARGAAGRQLRLARQLQFQRRAIAGIGQAARVQRGRMPRVDGPTARLAVFVARRTGPASQASPIQRRSSMSAVV